MANPGAGKSALVARLMCLQRDNRHVTVKLGWLVTFSKGFSTAIVKPFAWIVPLEELLHLHRILAV